jgi:transcriptional regulator with XRE-family HTH domain
MGKSIGTILEEMWTKAGYASLGELYRDTGITVATLSRIKNDVQTPSPETLEKLAPALNTTHENLMIIAGYLKTPGQATDDLILREKLVKYGEHYKVAEDAADKKISPEKLRKFIELLEGEEK